MGSERRPYQCKYWNLRPVVMPECSLIATRNSHAKHNKSVGPYLSTVWGTRSKLTTEDDSLGTGRSMGRDAQSVKTSTTHKTWKSECMTMTAIASPRTCPSLLFDTPRWSASANKSCEFAGTEHIQQTGTLLCRCAVMYEWVRAWTGEERVQSSRSTTHRYTASAYPLTTGLTRVAIRRRTRRVEPCGAARYAKHKPTGRRLSRKVDNLTLWAVQSRVKSAPFMVSDLQSPWHLAHPFGFYAIVTASYACAVSNRKSRRVSPPDPRVEGRDSRLFFDFRGSRGDFF